VLILEIIDRISLLLADKEQKELTNYLGLNSVAFSEWKSGKSKSYRKYLIEIAAFFNVSLDYLVYGKENQTKTLTTDEQELLENYKKLSPEDKKEVSAKAEELAKEPVSEENLGKQRLLKMYDLLTVMEKGEILGELKAMTKNRNPDINIQTVRVAARSTDNAPPRMVTGDFSDILNAPDATNEY